VHTPDGAKLLSNFVHKVAGIKGDWTMAAFRVEAIRRIRDQVGKGRVICGLSAAWIRLSPPFCCTRRSATSSPASSSITA